MTATPVEIERHLVRCRVVRVAAQLPSGRPLVIPLWFVRRQGRVYVTQRDGSPLVRAIASHPEVVLVFDPEAATGRRRVLRTRGRAEVHRDRRALTSIVARHAARYHLHPRALRGYVRHPERVAAIVRYYSERSRRSVVVEVWMTHTEFVIAPQPW